MARGGVGRRVTLLPGTTFLLELLLKRDHKIKIFAQFVKMTFMVFRLVRSIYTAELNILMRQTDGITLSLELFICQDIRIP